jgi:precorrin-6B methylase 2
MTYVALTGHRSMALDAIRNAAYERALAQVIRPESVVLDLGAGTGVHGLIAAKLGARRVYLIEPEDIIAVAEESVRMNGLESVVSCIHDRVEAVTLPEPVDVIVSVLTGNLLLTEDLLPALFNARDRFLRPGGSLVPDAATIVVAAISAPTLHEQEIAGWSIPQHGVSLQAGRPYAANSVFYRSDNADAVSYLSEPVTIHRLDLHDAEYGPFKGRVEVSITQPGLCHGWAGWISIKLGDTWLSTSPGDKRTHWSWGFLPLDPPLPVEAGERIRFQLARAPFGDWVWRTEARAGTQQHSTLLSMPVKAATLQKAALDYRPVLSDEGRDVEYVLARCNGSERMDEIAASLQAAAPTRYRTSTEALRFVQSVVKQHA